jgi:hypothetical protein
MLFERVSRPEVLARLGICLGAALLLSWLSTRL